MNIFGLEIGFILILVFGLGHVLIIKRKYYWDVISWPGMLAVGISLIVGSLFAGNIFISSALGMFGATLFWGIYEAFKQCKRAEKGLFSRRFSIKEPISHIVNR